MLTRRQSIKLLLAATPAAACAEAFYFEPKRLSITRKEIFLPALPAELDGITLAHLTDFHYKPESDAELIAKTIDALNREHVDIICLTGDYVTDDSSVFPVLVDHLAKLKAKHGIFASMGNHDGWTQSHDYFQSHFEQAGIRFLVNENIQLEINNTPLHIAASDYVWLGKPNTQQSLAGIPNDQTVIALVHEPDYFDTMCSVRRIDLQLSGHTHGGQCRVPFIGYAPVKVRHGEKYIYGHYQSDDSQLFVSRGIGTSGLRVRFACPPELAILTLRSGSPQ